MTPYPSTSRKLTLRVGVPPVSYKSRMMAMELVLCTYVERDRLLGSNKLVNMQHVLKLYRYRRLRPIDLLNAKAVVTVKRDPIARLEQLAMKQLAALESEILRSI